MMPGLIPHTEQFVRDFLAHDHTGHDWWHIYRVRNTALKLARAEGADELVVELAALLHDVADEKLNGGDEAAGMARVSGFIKDSGVPVAIAEQVLAIIREVSYKGAGVATPVSSVESAVVQDADRLDALGAVGIARMFTYGGARGRIMYHPDIPPVAHQSAAEYRTAKSTTFNHFYEKLLLLKDRMNTASGRQLAEERHQFMQEFIRHFLQECGK
jgi:uncharacterized protein